MSTVRRPRRRQVGQRPAPGPMRLRLRWLAARVYGPFVRAFRSRRSRRGRAGPGRPRAWHRSRVLVRLGRLATYVVAALFVLWVLRALYVVLWSRPASFPMDVEKACEDTDFNCDALAGILLPLSSLALASAVFLLYRHTRVHRPFVHKAREKPREVVQTAGSLIGQVVGRDELCQVMIDDLRDRGTRRPQVVIGGVGTGKTALLVRLTELLAERGAVPVPVRLRDAQGRLDFRELARVRFLAESDAKLLSDAEGEKVWRQLCKDDRVVVLADGLEEALIEGEAENERDTMVRLAVRRANDAHLPLIIASRPHDPLRVLEATIVELEPLSEEAALQFIQQRDIGDDEHRLDWIVETADVAETPLYLQITRQLRRLGLLDFVSHGGRTSGSTPAAWTAPSSASACSRPGWRRCSTATSPPAWPSAGRSARSPSSSCRPWPASGCARTASMSGSMTSRATSRACPGTTLGSPRPPPTPTGSPSRSTRP